MLRMSKLADYGTVVMTYIARQPERLISAGEIAHAVGLEQPTVSKLLKLMTHAGLLVSRRGAAGGYSLSRPSQRISMADIIDAIEGSPMGLTECSSVPGLCTRESTCSVRANWQRISQSIRGILAEITLDDLLLPETQAISWRKHTDGVVSPTSMSESMEALHEHRNQVTG
ncbi:MAG TPA: SUF system Fe-S cluster assembly regulator [Methylophilaceae bacterium]|jgi:FeS assembly SUF system regulator|nr:SUF system Fe-S cluster assembly regulator [Methylophilaceae bacterium]